MENNMQPMIINTNQNIELNNAVSFFDFWHYNEMDEPVKLSTEKVSASISEKIKAKQICKELPDHCAQFLFVS